MILLLLACADPPGPPAALADPLTAGALEETLLRITAIGPRMVGTPAEAEAADLVETLLLETGVADIRREPFTWDAWQPGSASLLVDGQLLAAEALSPSPSVSGLTLPLRSSEEDLTHAAALFSSDEGSRAEAWIRAGTGGADALIRVTEAREEDGGLLVEVGHTFEGSQLPCLAVDAEVGEILRAASEVEIEIESTTIPELQSENILAILPGTREDRVYITAHYDSWFPSESAFDNGLGVAMLVQLAAAAAQAGTPERTLVFLSTSGEEQGLQGALAYADAHDAEIRQDGELVINLDIPWSHEGDYGCMASEEALAEAAVAANATEGLEAAAWGSPSPSSDHFVFQTRGVDALWCTRQPDRHYHTSGDTVDWLDMDEAAAALRATWAVLGEGAGL